MQTFQFDIIIPDTLNQFRLDAALSQLLPQYSRSLIQQWIKKKFVSVNHSIVEKTRHTVKTGDRIAIDAVLEEATHNVAQDIPLNIIFEDEYLLVVNKPVGLIVHPGAGNPDRTLVNALLHYCSALSAIPRAGIVHRLDKDTSGLLIVAKTLSVHHALIKQMQARKVHREYRALVQGNMISGGTIDAPIARHPTQRIKMAVHDNGKEAVTHYRVLTRFASHTLLEVALETGRTHQIRVHLAHLGYPIVGDKTYGKMRHYPKLPLETQNALRDFHHQALHAYRLSLIHPVTKVEMEWTAELPRDFIALIALLSREYP